jgi:telomerase reverse transcriptase
VDVKSCFDTIDQDKLLEIILKVIKSDEYILHKFCEMNMDQGKVRKKFSVRASAAGTLFSSEGDC